MKGFRAFLNLYFRKRQIKKEIKALKHQIEFTCLHFGTKDYTDEHRSILIMDYLKQIRKLESDLYFVERGID